MWGRKGASRTQWKIVKVYRVTEMKKQTKEETLVRLCGQGNVISKQEYHFPEGKPAMHFLYMETYGDGVSSPSCSPAVRGLHLEEAQLLVLK